jgi:hypothetical protein
MDDIRRHWFSKEMMAGRDHNTEIIWKQRGGAIVYVGTHPIQIHEVVNGSSIFIHGGHKQRCFELELFPKSQTAILKDVIRRTSGCFMDDNDDSRDIVRAAYQIAKERGIKLLQLTDNSAIYCPERINLADLSFLTTGQTWYESIIPLTHVNIPLLEEWRHNVRTNTWREVGDGVLTDVDTTGIDIDAPGSAMAVLNRLKLGRKHCSQLSAKMDTLIMRSKILSLAQKEWICHIPQDPMLRGSSSRQLRRTTRRESTRKAMSQRISSMRRRTTKKR